MNKTTFLSCLHKIRTFISSSSSYIMYSIRHGSSIRCSSILQETIFFLPPIALPDTQWLHVRHGALYPMHYTLTDRHISPLLCKQYPHVSKVSSRASNIHILSVGWSVLPSTTMPARVVLVESSFIARDRPFGL